MSKRTYIYVEGRGMVEGHRVPRERRAPAIISDTTEPFYSHADGKTYTSKSEYRKECRRLGYEEVGNEYDGFDLSKPKLPPIEDDLEEAAAKLGIDW